MYELMPIITTLIIVVIIIYVLYKRYENEKQIINSIKSIYIPKKGQIIDILIHIHRGGRT